MRLPRTGEIFEDRFTVQETLGEGAFGLVVRAHDPGSDRFVALKFLKPDDGASYTQQTRSRFRREVQIISQLRDPHTVRLFNYGESRDGLLYMVFEHVPGRDLSAVIDEMGRLPPELVTHIVRQVLQSLREAHDAGMIHRDLKPENIRVSAYQGDPFAVKVLDFGIARGTDSGHPSITKTGELVGTPRYMSPEQLFSSPLSASSDIYSLGLIAFELLMGRDAMAGSSMSAQLDRLRTGHQLSMPALDGAGGHLMRVIERMTARDSGARYASAAAVLNALDTPGSPVATVAPVSSPLPSAAPPVRSRRALVAVVALVAGLVAVSAFFMSGTAPPSERPESKRRAHTALLRQPEPVPELGVALPAPSPDLGAVPDAAETVEIPAGTEGCGSGPVEPGLGVLDGTLTYVPSGYDERVPHPVIILVHGDYLSASDLVQESGFIEIADREGVVLLAPEDQPTPIPGAATWRTKEGVDKIRGAYQKARTSLCLDTNRAYMLGHAVGGEMALELSCEGWLSGVAFNAAALDVKAGDLCSKPIPALWLHVMNSPHISVDGSPNCMNVHQRTPKQTESAWLERNHCERNKVPVDKVRGGTCKRFECEVPFEMCQLDGGTLWPNGTVEFWGHGILGCGGDSPVDFPVAEQAWDFFRTTPTPSNMPQ